jgi:Fe-S cluster assembly scaffold protein SufB
MGIQSFLKAQRGDPDWAFTPEQYFDKEFKIIDANLIELAPGKTDQVVLRQSPTEKDMLAKHIRIDIREGANLDLTIINEATDKMQQVFIYEIRVREGGIMKMGLFVKGGKLNKHMVEVTLDEGALFSSYGHMINDIAGDCEVITKIEHRGDYTASDQFFTAEAGDDSQTVFQSMAHVPKDAKMITVLIDNTNLITSETGQCQGVPEVYNNSSSARVKCISTTEFIDQERVYYLQTRGFSKAEAETLIKNSHRNAILDEIDNDEIREEILQLWN